MEGMDLDLGRCCSAELETGNPSLCGAGGYFRGAKGFCGISWPVMGMELRSLRSTVRRGYPPHALSRGTLHVEHAEIRTIKKAAIHHSETLVALPKQRGLVPLLRILLIRAIVYTPSIPLDNPYKTPLYNPL